MLNRMVEALIAAGFTDEQINRAKVAFLQKSIERQRASNNERQRRFKMKRKITLGNVIERYQQEINKQYQCESKREITLDNVTEKTGGIYNIDSKYCITKGRVSNSKNHANYSAEFEDFWRIYPKRKGKKAASKAFCKARIETSKEEILSGALHLASKYPDGSDLTYVKDPSTWLNQGCWSDDPNHVGPSKPQTKPLTFREATILQNRKNMQDLLDGKFEDIFIKPDDPRFQSETPLDSPTPKLLSSNGKSCASGNAGGNGHFSGGLFGKDIS